MIAVCLIANYVLIVLLATVTAWTESKMFVLCLFLTYFIYSLASGRWNICSVVFYHLPFTITLKCTSKGSRFPWDFGYQWYTRRSMATFNNKKAKSVSELDNIYNIEQSLSSDSIKSYREGIPLPCNTWV